MEKCGKLRNIGLYPNGLMKRFGLCLEEMGTSLKMLRIGRLCHRCRGNKEIQMEVKRDRYNAVIKNTIPEHIMKQIRNLVSAVAAADKVDEHGWEFGAEFDHKGRGVALNWDVYGWRKDFHNGRFLVVIQVRQYTMNKYANVKKSYFLIGRNEDDTAFAHPVHANVVHNAVRRGDNVVIAVQNWLFDAPYEKVVRHGDMALVPMKRSPAGQTLDVESVIIQPEDGSASHVLCADRIVENGNLYALNPHMTHEPGTHPDVCGDGWYKVIPGKRVSFHSFAPPTID